MDDVVISGVEGLTADRFSINSLYTRTGKCEYRHETGTTWIRLVQQKWTLFYEENRQSSLMRSESTDKELTAPGHSWEVYNSKSKKWARQTSVSVQLRTAHPVHTQPLRNQQCDVDGGDAVQPDQKRQKNEPAQARIVTRRASAAATASCRDGAMDSGGYGPALVAVGSKVAAAAWNVASCAKRQICGDGIVPEPSDDATMHEGETPGFTARGKNPQHLHNPGTTPPAPPPRDSKKQDHVGDLKRQLEDVRQECAGLINQQREDRETRKVLHQEVANLQQANKQLIQQGRAVRSGAAAGNNNIMSDFPFKSQNKECYAKIIAGALDLLDPCLEAEDIPWACAVSKHIFNMCCAHTQKYVLDLQQDFKTKALVGESAKVVSEWENTRCSMVKTQRLTLSRILSQLKDEMKSPEGDFRTLCQRPALAKLLLRSAKINNFLQKFVNTLTKVGHPRSAHKKRLKITPTHY